MSAGVEGKKPESDPLILQVRLDSGLTTQPQEKKNVAETRSVINDKTLTGGVAAGTVIMPLGTRN